MARRVLVVDDDEGVRTGVTWAVEADGISDASAHILSIVDDVLDLARVGAGAMPMTLDCSRCC